MIRDMVVLAPGAYDVDVVSDATGLLCEDESMAVQSDKEDADINTIVRRFGLTGQLPQGMAVPSFQEFADVFDYQSAQNVLVAARESFMELPAEVRIRFANDPQRFLEFCAAEEDGKLKNLEEMRKLGLAVPAAEEQTPEGPPVEDKPKE